MIEVLLLTPDDWQVWRRLRLAALADAPQAFGARLSDWQGDGDREERWRGRLEIPGSINVVAVVDGEPAGMASGVPAGAGAAELISMWVSPSARGRGVSDRLVHVVDAWAREEGFGALRLAVAQGNDHAVALYRRNGFRDTGETCLMPDGARTEHIMAKTLATGTGP